MSYPTLTDAAAALGINIATLIEQLQRLEHDVGTTLFHRTTPASEPQRPTRRGAHSSKRCGGRTSRPFSTPPSARPNSMDGQPRPRRRPHRPTFRMISCAPSEAKQAAGPAWNARHHRPTRRGDALLKALTRPDIQHLRAARARLPRLAANHRRPLPLTQR